MWGGCMLTYTAARYSVNRVCGADSFGSSEVWDNTRICLHSVNLVNISILQGTPSEGVCVCGGMHVYVYSYLRILRGTPNADRAAAAATRGSTTDARKATVDMTGLPC